jgi:hypothetical protein
MLPWKADGGEFANFIVRPRNYVAEIIVVTGW